MFKKIIRYYAIKGLVNFDHTRQRNKKINTLNNSKNIGIIWNPSDEGSIETYEMLRKILQSKGIKATGIAHIESITEMETLTTVTHSGFLYKTHVSWFGRPKTNAGLHFIQETFDILIDLTITKTVPLLYLLVHSPSIFKVGWKGEGPNFLDLDIDVTEKPNCMYLMEQMVYYLENIN